MPLALSVFPCLSQVVNRTVNRVSTPEFITVSTRNSFSLASLLYKLFSYYGNTLGHSFLNSYRSEKMGALFCGLTFLLLV